MLHALVAVVANVSSEVKCVYTGLHHGRRRRAYLIACKTLAKKRASMKPVQAFATSRTNSVRASDTPSEGLGISWAAWDDGKGAARRDDDENAWLVTHA